MTISCTFTENTDGNHFLRSLVQHQQENVVHNQMGSAARSGIAARSPLLQHEPLAQLKAKRRDNHALIREFVLAADADVIRRTQAHNRKCVHDTIEEAQAERADIVLEQIRAWRSVLPKLLRQLSHIPDPRCASSIKHKLAVIMAFGLFAFVFRLTSRREMNRELTQPVIQAHLQKLFPEIDSIPHADTLARLLNRINPLAIESLQVSLVKELLERKKFKKLLLNGCLPITVDGTQKLYRDNLLQDPRWCERLVGDKNHQRIQQYLYVVEVNITLKNDLTIPLMSEFLYRENNQLIQDEGKQDSETTAFERIAVRLKKYFPRLRLILFMDAMYATQSVMGILNDPNV